MCLLCRLPVAKKHNFGQILTFLFGCCTDPLLPMRAKFGVLQTHGICLRAKFRLDRFILSPCWGKPKFLPFFGLRHLVLSPTGSSPRKLNTGAQLQTFPYPTASKSFLYSNGFMAKLGAQSLIFKSVTNIRQTGRQTDKKLNVFGHPGGG